MTDKRIEYGSGSESEPTKANVRPADPKRETKAAFKIGRMVQKEVVEDRNGEKLRYARRFFIHDKMYQKEYDRWLYQLNIEQDGKAGEPYNHDKWYKERDLSHIS